MADKFRERLLQSSGVSNRRVESEYAKKVMAQMGWKEGNGLGKNQHGSKDCVQIRRREDNLGLGQKALGETNWKDEWWNDAYNNSIKKLNILPKKFQKSKVTEESSSSDDSSDDSSTSSTSSILPSLFTKKK